MKIQIQEDDSLITSKKFFYEFYIIMNILINNFTTFNRPVFGAKKSVEKTLIPEPLTSDLLYAVKDCTENLPQKVELTTFEKEFNEILKERNRVERNLGTQKTLLRDFYSFQDKADYKELQKVKNQLVSKLNRIAKKSGIENSFIVEVNVDSKKQYNYYAPKIFRIQNLEELLKLKEAITNTFLYNQARVLLGALIKQQAKRLIK